MTKTGIDFRCVVCGGQDLRCTRSYRPRRGFFRHTSVGECRSCGLLQAVPMPSLDDLNRFYESEYRVGEAPEASSPYEDPEDCNYRTLSQLELIRDLQIKPASIVEVGCGFGLLLSRLKKEFPEASLAGIEISSKCHGALERLGIELACTTLEREGKNPFNRQFDLLLCSHVLEHSCDPVRFLTICRSMLRPGGRVLFEVPDCEHVYGSDWPHVLFFTPATLQRTMERNGFEVLKCQACGPTIDRWALSPRQRLQQYAEDHLPEICVTGLKSIWRLARGRDPSSVANHESTCMKEEAKDKAWFTYQMPGFRHIAIRCVAGVKS
jgi:SAM-dependent methyltransferase